MLFLNGLAVTDGSSPSDFSRVRSCYFS